MQTLKKRGHSRWVKERTHDAVKNHIIQCRGGKSE